MGSNLVAEIVHDGHQVDVLDNLCMCYQPNIHGFREMRFLEGVAVTTAVSGDFDIGSGTRLSINSLVRRLKAASGPNAAVRYGPPCAGDVRDSLVGISMARKAFGLEPTVTTAEKLPGYTRWARTEVAS